jgi:TonB family protein
MLVFVAPAAMRAAAVVWLVDYLVNAAWLVPAVLAAAMAAAGMMRRMRPEAGHRVWVGALGLAVVLPGCRIAQWPRLWWSHANTAGGHVRVEIVPGVAQGGAGLRLAPALIAVLLAVYAGTAVYFAARLAWGLWRTRRMRREAVPAQLREDAQARWDALRARMGGAEAELLLSASVAGPVVVGVWHRTLLVPRDFFTAVEACDQDAALAHELAHVRRVDYAKNLGYSALMIVMAWHPCAWLLHKRIAQSREMVCDAMAARVLAGRKKYAQSLLRLAMAMPAGLNAGALPAVGIFDGNTLERRVVAMMDKRKELSGAARLAVVAGAVLLGGALCASAAGMRVDVAAGLPAADSAGPPKLIHVSSSVMAGNIVSKPEPKYPAKAKADHDTVDGTCVLGATINKEGQTTRVHVVKSLRKDYDESAMTAVRQWRYKPYLLNGEPVAVQTTVNITYTLGN